MLNKIIKLLAICVVCLPAFVYAQDPLGDTDSFGTNVKFAGSVTTGTVTFMQDCQTTPVPQCFKVAGNTLISYDFRDLGRINFPPNTFQNIIYPQIRNSLEYSFLNSTSQNLYTLFWYDPYITILSPVLSDPALINPLGGQPFNGKIDIPLSGKHFQNTLVANGVFSVTENVSPVVTNGFNKKFFMNTYGLSQAAVDNIFAGKLEIRLNMRGKVRSLDSGFAGHSIRFLGN
jgi:hypothetical protein